MLWKTSKDMNTLAKKVLIIINEFRNVCMDFKTSIANSGNVEPTIYISILYTEQNFEMYFFHGYFSFPPQRQLGYFQRPRRIISSDLKMTLNFTRTNGNKRWKQKKSHQLLVFSIQLKSCEMSWATVPSNRLEINRVERCTSSRLEMRIKGWPCEV